MADPITSTTFVVDVTSQSTAAGVEQAIQDKIALEEANGWVAQGIDVRHQTVGGSTAILAYILMVQGSAVGAPVQAAGDGRKAKQYLVATYDFAEHGGAIGTITLADKLPTGAIMTRTFYKVDTTFTSSTDAATVRWYVATDAINLKAAIAISDGSNPWDSGWHDGIQDNTVANFSAALSAELAIAIDIAVEAVTAGKATFFIEYVLQ